MSEICFTAPNDKFMVEKAPAETISEPDDYHTPQTVEELTEQNVETIVQLRRLPEQIKRQASELPRKLPISAAV